jgi:acid-sensing ion channel, other
MQYDFPRALEGYDFSVLQTSMTFVFDPKIITTSEELQTYSVDVRKCFFSNERHLKYFAQYTQLNCRTDCEAVRVLKECGCLLIFIEGKELQPTQNVFITFIEFMLSGHKDYDTCGLRDHACVDYFILKLELSIYLECNCLPACTSINFETEILFNQLNVTSVNGVNKQKYSLTWVIQSCCHFIINFSATISLNYHFTSNETSS